MGPDPVSGGAEERFGWEFEGGSADAGRGKAEMSLAREQLEHIGHARFNLPDGECRVRGDGFSLDGENKYNFRVFNY
jgi:hypothetical protein